MDKRSKSHFIKVLAEVLVLWSRCKSIHLKCDVLVVGPLWRLTLTSTAMRLWQVCLNPNVASISFFLLVFQPLEFLMPWSTCHYLPGIYIQKKFDVLS